MEFEKIRDIIADKMDIDKDEIALESTFESLQIDSLDMVEIVIELEDVFNVSIETGEGLTTVSDLVDYIKQNK